MGRQGEARSDRIRPGSGSLSPPLLFRSQVSKPTLEIFPELTTKARST